MNSFFISRHCERPIMYIIIYFHIYMYKHWPTLLKNWGGAKGGNKGGKSPPKDFKKGENEKIWGIFMYQSY